MPLSRELLGMVLDNCNSVRERFLILFVKDVEGANLPLANLSTSDVDQANGLLRVRSTDETLGRSVRLSRDTMKTFHEYMSERRDKESALFINPFGGRPGEAEIRATVREISSRCGLPFDESRLTFNTRRATAAGQRIVVKNAPRDMFYLYGVVSHPLRHRIVELLGDEGPLGFTQVKSRLNVRVGTLYYHFDMLSGLIAQDRQKKYMLTEVGRAAYDHLRSADYERTTMLVEDKLSPTTRSSIVRWFRLDPILSGLQSQSPLAILGVMLTLAAGLAMVSTAGLETVMFFLNPASSSPFALALEFLASWLSIFIVADLMATYLFGRRGEHVILLLGSAYSLVPLVLFATWWNFVIYLPVNPGVLSVFAFSRVLLIIVQAASIGILGRLIGGLKGLRLDKAAVICLALAYLSITVAYFRGV